MSEKVLIFFLFVAVLAGMGGSYWYLNEIPFMDARENLEGEVEQLRRQINAFPEVTQQIVEAQEQFTRLQNEFSSLADRIQQGDPKIPEIISEVQEYSEQAKVNFTEVRFENMRPHEDYDELPMEFTAIGPYHSIARFVSRLENLRLINARVGQLSLTPTGGGGGDRRRRGGDEEIEVQLQITATAYIFKGGIGSAADDIF